MSHTMRAMVFEEYGGPEVLQLKEIPVPEPGADEILIRVRVAGLNRVDLAARQGYIKVPLPHISGAEVAGEVARLGENVTGFELGEHVVVAPYFLAKQPDDIVLDEETLRISGDLLGLFNQGSYAEYVKVPAYSAVRIPENLTYEEAAAQSLATITAWHMLVSKAGVRPGEKVLVHAAGSGVGAAAVQIAKLWGAFVIATAGRNDKLEKAKELGADEVINYNEQDFLKVILDMTNYRGVDMVVEQIGRDTWEKSVSCVARNGRLVICGATSGSTVQLDLGKLFGKQVMVIGSQGGSKDELEEVLRLTEQGRLKAVIDKVYPLEEARAAQERLANREHFGKILLSVG
jgi:NADPH:quinone reductase-like Zn-dependent oxidoreductase